MRIALVVTGGFDRSGRERVIPSLLWLVERLAREHDVFVYVLRYHDAPCTYPLAGATIRDLGRPSGVLAQAHALHRALRADGPFDVLHAYWAQPAGRLVSLLGRLTGTPTVVTLDSGEFASLPQIGYGLQTTWQNRLAVRAATRLATRDTVCSEFHAALARAHGCSPLVIPLGVDTAIFTARSTSPHGPPFRLLHVASQNPVKDQATLLRTVHRLVTNGLDVHLDIVGEDTMRGALVALTRELQLEPRVTFHGFLASEQLVPLYHAAHLFVLTSLHEAAGVVLLEAAACGVPVTGSAVGYLADWNGDRAVAVPPSDHGALASAIRSLLLDDTRRHALATAASAWATTHDADWTARAFSALYRELAGSR
ncbi:MAG: glycosyltransferase family 4 protein [Vicinamibacterales bacterium]